MDSVHVLLVEDNPGDARLIKELLAEAGMNISVEWVDLLSKGIERLRNGNGSSVDALLLDLSLPDSHGFDTFIKARSADPRTPIIMLTGMSDEAIACRAVREGAQDYLVKGQVDGFLLGRAIRYAIERKQAEEALRESENRYSALFESSMDAIITFDTKVILDCNAATVRMFGYNAKADLIGRRPNELTPPGDTKTDQKNMALTLQEAKDKGSAQREMTHQRANGELFPADVLISPVIIKGQEIFQATIRDITEQKKAEETLKRYQDFLENLSLTDGLARAANRRNFDRFLDYEWNRAMRIKTPLSLIMIDIDHFKAYNDHYGHVAGDDCLRTIVRCLSSVAHRATDLVARYGGEEFACVLPETDHAGALVVATRINEAVNKAGICHEYSPVTNHVTISIGVATMIPETNKSFSDLIKEADELLYEAKDGGRNRVCSRNSEEHP